MPMARFTARPRTCDGRHRRCSIRRLTPSRVCVLRCATRTCRCPPEHGHCGDRQARWMPSPYWGDRTRFGTARATTHNPMMDEKGRVWLSLRGCAAPANPGVLQGRAPSHPSAQGRSRCKESQSPAGDASTRRAVQIQSASDTCFGDAPPDTSRLRRQRDAVDERRRAANPRGRLAQYRKLFEETGDEPRRRRAGAPLVVDTNGNGKRDDGGRARTSRSTRQKDKRVVAGLLRGAAVSPVDGCGAGALRSATPAYGSDRAARSQDADPTQRRRWRKSTTCRRRASGRAAATSTARACVWASLGERPSWRVFDRRKCKAPANGPNTRPASSAPRAGPSISIPARLRRHRREQRRGRAITPGSTSTTRSGLGEDVPMSTGNRERRAPWRWSDGKMGGAAGALSAELLRQGSWTGASTIPNGGWKGRGLWSDERRPHALAPNASRMVRESLRGEQHPHDFAAILVMLENLLTD